MRSLSNAIWTSGLPVSVGCVPYWSMRVFFCSLASTNLMHSCRLFSIFYVTSFRVTRWRARCKGEDGSKNQSCPHLNCFAGQDWIVLLLLRQKHRIDHVDHSV